MADVPQRQVDEKFYAYPRSKIVGIIETPDDLQGSQGRWDRAGRHRDAVWPAGIEQLDRSGKRHGLVAQLIWLAQFMGEEQTHLQQHEEELAAEHFFVSMVVGNDESTKRRYATC